MSKPRQTITLTCERCQAEFERDAIRHRNAQAYGRKAVFCGRACMLKSTKNPWGFGE